MLNVTIICSIALCRYDFTLTFRCLDAVPSGATYIVMCIVIRCVDACGSCAFCTASLAILANEFPNNVSTIFVCSYLFYKITV